MGFWSLRFAVWDFVFGIRRLEFVAWNFGSWDFGFKVLGLASSLNFGISNWVFAFMIWNLEIEVLNYGVWYFKFRVLVWNLVFRI